MERNEPGWGGSAGLPSRVCAPGELSAEPRQHQAKPCSPARPQVCDRRVTGACSALGDRAAPSPSGTPEHPGLLINQGGPAGNPSAPSTGSAQSCTESAQEPESSGNIPGSATINSCLSRDLPAPTALTAGTEQPQELPGAAEANLLNPQPGREGLHSKNWI